MTEEEWLNCASLEPMVRFLQASGSERRWRLVLCGCCRSAWELLRDENRHSVLVAEHHADGKATEAELEEARWAADNSAVTADSRVQMLQLSLQAPDLPEWEVRALRRALDARHAGLTAAMMAHAATFHDVYSVRQALLSVGPALVPHATHLVRDLFGPVPFRPLPVIHRHWLTWKGGTVKLLAESIYEERSLPSGRLDNNQLAVLADALEDAGCTDLSLLGHLRDPSPHYRGAWGIDLLLGKE